ncbi:ATPase family AAA domain-containing protein 2-like isoform X2 [Gigantopelta aegis]|uniref:ATPase family AAA domain-containing protein 2-like isoform X2 n=1 Tax=Gigantopelta aegis TaxID=1735272 RepID=UPI001B887902|nr:ATPase family AAA domain-containing protein 2-like isoform X2 [Gigantopelta aegis]
MVRTRHTPGEDNEDEERPSVFVSLNGLDKKKNQIIVQDDVDSEESGISEFPQSCKQNLDDSLLPPQRNLRPKIRSSGAYFINGSSDEDSPSSRSRAKKKRRKSTKKMSPKENKRERHCSKQLRGITSNSSRNVVSEKDEEEYNSAVRRSSRQKRLVYDSLKGSQTPNETGKDDPGVRSSKKRKVENNQLFNEDEAGDHNSDANKFSDMYSRVKRPRPKVKRDMYGVPINSSESEGDSTLGTGDECESSGDDGAQPLDSQEKEDGNKEEPKSYYMREHRPRTQHFEVRPEPIRRKTQIVFRGETPPLSRHQTKIYRSPAHRRRCSYRKRAAFHDSSDSTSSSSDESSDEERFQHRKAKSMARARNRCLPMNLSAEDLQSGILRERTRIGASLADIDPMAIDRSITFESVGGLFKHIRALKEMVVFPLMYPEIFERFKISPPRGVLFHGPPGTGKTLMARALANECSTGEKRVAFFMRKGADCLSKWVGESERQLRLLFDQAYQVRPSIIFFDEIDGLAPVRSSRQDQIHSSIVSTLLALMDGLDSRGEIVVIGATNRIDSIDPALRRPGRFDREFLFPLPTLEARKQILQINTKDWKPKLSSEFISELGHRCIGYCGADLKALCTEAALLALRRRYPQIYTSNEKLQLDVSSINVSAKDFFSGMQVVVPTAQRSVTSPARPLSKIVQPLLKNSLQQSLSILQDTFPSVLAQMASFDAPVSSHAKEGDALLEEMASEDESGPSIFENCRSRGRKSLSGNSGSHDDSMQNSFLNFSSYAYNKPSTYRPRLLISGMSGMGQTAHVGPAILHYLEQLPVHVLDLPTLYAISAKTPEESCAQVFREAKRAAPSIVYMPYINQWWEVLGETLRATFLTLIEDMDPTSPLLILATSEAPYSELESMVQMLFDALGGEVLQMVNPTSDQRREFFQDLILVQAAKPVSLKKVAAKRLLEVLPKAPPPEPRKLTEAEKKKLREQEDATLRELRIFLRDILNKLGRDRKFGIFTKPVDIADAPDYYDIIHKPMDLSTMMSKIDLHHYHSTQEFLRDIGLICSNALEYNPSTDTAGRAIRHRACALKDTAHAMIKTELDPEFEKHCREVAESRKRRGENAEKSAPDFCYTVPIYQALNKQNYETPKARRMHPQSERCSRRVRGLDVEFNMPLNNVEKQWSDQKRGQKSPEKSSPDDGSQKKEIQNSQSPTLVKTKSKPRKKCIWATTKRRKKQRMSTSPKRSPNNQVDINDSSDSEIEFIPHSGSAGKDIPKNVSGSSPPHYSTPSQPDSAAKAGLAKSLPSTEMHDLVLDSGVGSSLDSNGDSVDSVDHAKEKAGKLSDRISPNQTTNTNSFEYNNVEQEQGPGCAFRVTRTRIQTKDQEKALEVLESPIPPLIVDQQRLHNLLQRIVLVTDNYTVGRLEKLHSVLSQCVFKHRKQNDKTHLIKEMEEKVESLTVHARQRVEIHERMPSSTRH